MNIVNINNSNVFYNEFTVICGEVASGKTYTLKKILNELDRSRIVVISSSERVNNEFGEFKNVDIYDNINDALINDNDIVVFDDIYNIENIKKQNKKLYELFRLYKHRNITLFCLTHALLSDIMLLHNATNVIFTSKSTALQYYELYNITNGIKATNKVFSSPYQLLLYIRHEKNQYQCITFTS